MRKTDADKRRVGVMISLTNDATHLHHVFQGIKQYALENERWQMFADMFCDERLAPDKEPLYHGVVGRATLELYERAEKRGLPVVNVYPSSPVVDRLPSVLPDHAGAMRLAVEHLLARGVSNFGLMVNEGAAWQPFHQAINDRLAPEGLECSVCALPAKTVSSAEEMDFERSLMIDWLQAIPKPTGVIGLIDHYVAALADNCELHTSISIPHELALIGLGNHTNICERPSVSLSSIDMNYFAVGYRAAELLDSLLDGADPPVGPIVIEPKGIVARGSTDVTAVDDQAVAAAMRYIADNCHRPIQVADVVDASPGSRRMLELRFEKACGRSISSQIEAMRIERAKRLLAQSDEPAKVLAPQCGFGSYNHMLRAFRRRENMTPNEFRTRL